jgi:hypothetical protein
VESVAQEVASFGIGMTIVEPGGARTEFRYGSAQVAKLTPIYDQTPAHIASCGCSIPRMAWPPVTRPEWRRASSRASTWSLRRCAWCSAHRRWRAPSATLRKRIAGFEAQTGTRRFDGLPASFTDQEPRHGHEITPSGIRGRPFRPKDFRVPCPPQRPKPRQGMIFGKIFGFPSNPAQFYFTKCYFQVS